MATRRAATTRTKASTVKKAVPLTTVSRNITSLYELCYYAALHDMMPDTADRFFLKKHPYYQSWTNLHADEDVRANSAKDRFTDGVAARSAFVKLCRKYIEEARECEDTMHKYDATVFCNEKIPDSASIVSTIVSQSNAFDTMLDADSTLVQVCEKDNWLFTYVSGEIMAPPMPGRLLTHAQKLGHAFVGFIKMVSWTTAALSVFSEKTTLSLGAIGGIWVQLGMDVDTVYKLLDEVNSETENAKQERASKKGDTVEEPEYADDPVEDDGGGEDAAGDDENADGEPEEAEESS